ncbi:MAG TPA: hypothetical protein VLG38_02025 [Gammaproteobacteria bacterium]|nr:hypothetical protein [Gammaproteobacteria bacterium]
MFRLLFDPRGGIPRLPFLLGVVVSFVLLLLSFGLLLLPGYMFGTASSATAISAIIIYVLTVFVLLVSVWISFCVHLKRLYDLNVTRLLILLPFISVIANKYIPTSPQAKLMQIIMLVYTVALLFWPTRRKF